MIGVDSSKKGFLDFNKFENAISPNMVDSLVPLPNDEESYLYKKDRNNLVPNHAKIQENIAYHKSFTSRFTEIRDKLLPDKNILLSIFI